ncbi:hypothetical protein [Terricaulis sp.]|uniref:hypothetical protein n=1 Tax=Terricaulis sp. TaxID=2768686 RepID=UPI002AC76669|nr:hypothetical protein [Terricaulis sp.]MDZ4693180.1 hypothetical protein [Terricaulis sp.]
MRALVSLLALALVACGQTPEPTAEAPEVAAEEVAPSPFIGAYTAMSTTAMSITGDLDASADVLSFGKGFRIEGGRVDANVAGDTDLSAGGGTINSGSGIQVSDVELRRIENVRIAADAPSPNLCGGATASYVILGRNADTLTLQIFSGADAPGPNAHDTQLCGIYNYMPAA